ncbi:MAG TPA: DUF2269 family protein [Solirubrobacteraceae bacterium]|nr:DUF2269 family protein [Solirubrobacteraceae bacterium]
MTTTPAILFYDVVVAIHVMTIVIAFGVTFVYPAIIPWLTNKHPEAMPTIHEMQVRIGRFVITPFATLALLTGIYLAADRDLFDQTWVTIPFVIIIILLGLGGAFFTPREKQLAALARRDIDAGGTLSDEYHGRAKPVALVGALSSLLILFAIFCMVAKPFAS